jgi:hypothetical protein
MLKVLFVVKNEEIISILNESIEMVLPVEYDYIVWLPMNIWFGNHVRFISDRKVERIKDLNPKRYIYIKEVWDKFKEDIKQD